MGESGQRERMRLAGTGVGEAGTGRFVIVAEEHNQVFIPTGEKEKS